MFPNIKWLRITPDRAGRGGYKTAVHSFQQTPVNDVRELIGAHVYRGSWRRDFDPATYTNGGVRESQDFNGLGCLAIHGYTFPSLTNPAAAPTVKILEQNTHAAGVSVIWDTNGTTRQSRPGTNQQGTFLNIAGRCLFGDGGAEALLMDDRTPAIHSQPNQPLGIAMPTQSLTPNAFGNVTGYGSGYIFIRSWYLNHPNPDNMISTCIIGDTVDITPPNATLGASGWQLFLPQPSGPFVLTAGGVTSNTTTFTANGTISITTGTSIVTLAGSTWPADRKYAGLAINFNGYSYVIQNHGFAGDILGTYDINGNVLGGVIPTQQLFILGVYDGPTLTNVPYTITGAQVTLDPAHPSLAQYLNTGILGYSQSTNSQLFQVKVNCTQANGYTRNLGNISLGVASSASAISGGSILFTTDAHMKDGKKNVNSASSPFNVSDVGSPFFVDGAGSGGTVLSSSVAIFLNAAVVTLNDPNISGGDLLGVNAWWGADPIITNGVVVVPGFPNDLTSTSNPFVTGDVGKTIVVEGAGAAGASLITTIATYVGPGHVTLTAAASTNVTAARVWWRGISVDTHSGPTYAYAWYDPETGHMSNISPLYQIPRPTNIGLFTDFANITPAFQIDPGYISYPDGTVVTGGVPPPPLPTSDAVRFSHIVFFRTLSTPGSGTLYPIGSLMPFVAKVHPGSASTRGQWNPGLYKGWNGMPTNYAYAPSAVGAPNYWFDFSSDSDLLLSGGFRAPQFTNGKPMVLLRGGATQPGYPYALSYWDRRTWIVNTQEPDKIAFSCDEAQCPLGVPEESFPPTNFLRLPSAADGKVMGMRTVGDLLLITTQRFAYIVAGNNESNYRLLKISSCMAGVGTYQMDEFPTYTGAEGEPTTVFFLGTDRIVYQWTIGGPVTVISQPIQDQLDTALVSPAGQYFGSLLHCVSAWGRRLVVVAPNYTSGTPNAAITWIYDIEQQIWSRSLRNGADNPNSQGSGLIPMATVYGTSGVPVNEIYGILTNFGANHGVHAISWIRDDVATASTGMIIWTMPLTLDGKKTRKQIVSVNIHATAGVWMGVLIVNDSVSTPQFTFQTYPDPIDSIYAPSGIQGYGDDVIAQDIVCMAGQFNTDGTPIVGYRFALQVLRDLSDFTPAQVYAIDVGYIDMENPGDGDA